MSNFAAILIHSLRIDTRVGCMLESTLGVAASLVVANSVSNVKYIDLDGFTHLSNQPLTRELYFNNEMDQPIDGVAFSIEPNSVF